jgi:hypothetical protein
MEKPIIFPIIEKRTSTSNACAKRNVDGLLNDPNPLGFLFPFRLSKTMTNLLPPNTVPEFYALHQFTYDWHLVVYSHNEGSSFASRSEAAYTKREGLARDFMNRLQRRLGLRQKDLFFLGVTEFGDTQKGHLHLLLSFDGLRKKGRLDKIASSEVAMKAVVSQASKEMFRDRLKVDCETIRSSDDDQRRMLSYVCKKEFGHDYKHCFMSNWFTLATN